MINTQKKTLGYRKLLPGDAPRDFRAEFARDVLEGLSAGQKRVPSAYLYDRRGSELFREITMLDEYYPTKCEMGILDRHKAELALVLPREKLDIVELGPGDGSKAAVLLDQFLKDGLDFEYVPIDISEGAMVCLLDSCGRLGCGLRISGLVAEYSEALKWLACKRMRRSLVLFLGSNIGNMGPATMRSFLRSLWNMLKDGDLLLIGFDLKKEISVIERAYNDSKGVTREFNLNLLDRINRELGGDSSRENFEYHSRYSPQSGAVEGALVSRMGHEVNLRALGKKFHFDAWEGIATEYSHKFLLPEIESLAAGTGFTVMKHLIDDKKYFVDSLWRVRKGLKKMESAMLHNKEK